MAFVADCLDTVGVCPNRLWRVSFGQNETGERQLQLVEPGSGELIDLTKYGIPEGSSSSSFDPDPAVWGIPGVNKHGVEIVIKEMPLSPEYKAVMANVKSTEDAKNGIVYIPIDTRFSARAGVWLGMVFVWEHGLQRRNIPFYCDILPNLYTTPEQGPITFYEIRMLVRDMCPEFNFLIDQVEFQEEEIAYMIRRPVDQFNEAPPPLNIHFTPMDFPFRYNWSEAVIGELLIMSAIWMRRNDLDYSAAGLTVQDTKKWPTYLELGKERRTRYEAFVKNKKIEINIKGAYNTLLGYRAAPYR